MTRSTMSKVGFARFLALSFRSDGKSGWRTKVDLISLPCRKGFAVYRVVLTDKCETALGGYTHTDVRIIRVRL